MGTLEGVVGDLPHVLWIGGLAVAGKTTVSRLLARRHGLRWHSVGDHTQPSFAPELR